MDSNIIYMLCVSMLGPFHIDKKKENQKIILFWKDSNLYYYLK